jgi:hypothetical protein
VTTSITPTSPTAVTTVRDAEVIRLTSAASAAEAAAEAAATDAKTAAVTLNAATTAAASLGQDASVLLQQLATAQTGPERHAIELALNANRSAQFGAGLAVQAATEAKAVADLAATRATLAERRTAGALPQAVSAAASAATDAAADATALARLADTYPVVLARVEDLATPVTEAVTRLGVLLGGAQMVTRTNAAVRAARAAADQLTTDARLAHDTALATATSASPIDGAVTQTAAALAQARTAIADASTAPARVDAAATVIEAVRATAPPPEQPVVDAAAHAAADGTPQTYAAWLITLSDARIDQAVALLDAVAELNRVQAADPGDLRQDLLDADRRLATALSAQLTQRQSEDAATAAADAADAAVTAAPALDQRRRAAFLRGA